MLEWINGNAPSGHEDEAPDTPAHIFAARAFKTALFGTPAPPPEARGDTINVVMARQAECSVAASPTKGILVTPGTITTKRKSVSFGADSRAGADGAAAGRKSLETVEEAEEPASREPKEKSAAASKPLRRALFNKVKPFTSNESALFGNSRPSQRAAQVLVSKPETKPTQGPQESVAKPKPTQPEPPADVTVDLEQPRSVSGRHWMKEYKRDHATSKAEMKKLIRYSQNAKTQAMSKEQEATELREKLARSETRVEELEKELAKTKEERRSYETQKAKPDQPDEKKPSPTTSHPELAALRKAAKEAHLQAAKLEQENASFRQTILRVKDEMARYESRHKEWMAQRKRKDEKHAAQRKALKEKVVDYRNKLQEEFDSYQMQAQSEKAILLQEIERLRVAAGVSLAYSKEVDALLPPHDPLRDLLVRVHEKSPLKAADAGAGLFRTQDLGDVESPAPERRKPTSRTSLDRLKAILDDDDNAQRSSPTILDGHPRPDAPRDGEPKPSRRPTAASTRTRNTQILNLRDSHNVISNNENALPGHKSGTRKSSGDNAGRSRRDIRVRSRHGLSAGSHANSNSNSNSGLTPEREAAARLRIAQRSAQKQRSRKFFFDDDDGEWLTESRGVLVERALNRP